VAATTTNLYPEDPGRLLTAAEAALPDSYLTDRGEERPGRPRAVRIRADLAAFAHAARDLDRPFADRMAWRLQLFPWAVCVLGHTLPGGWEAYARDAADHVAAVQVAAGLAGHPEEQLGPVIGHPIDWPVPATIDTPELAALYRLAEQMFCPDGGLPVAGDASEHLPGWEEHDSHDVDTMKQLLPWWMLDVQLSGYSVEVNGTGAAGAVYAAVTAVPELDGFTGAGIHLMLPSACFGQQAFYKTLRPLTAPDRFVQEEYYGAFVDDAGDVNQELALRLEAQAILDVGCPSFTGEDPDPGPDDGRP